MIFRSETVDDPLHESADIAVVVVGLFRRLVSEFADRIYPLMLVAAETSNSPHDFPQEPDATLRAVEDLRGVGIQISRLSPPGTTKDIPTRTDANSRSILEYVGQSSIHISTKSKNDVERTGTPSCTHTQSLRDCRIDLECCSDAASEAEEEFVAAEQHQPRKIEGVREAIEALGSPLNAGIGKRSANQITTPARARSGHFDEEYVTESQVDFLTRIFSLVLVYDFVSLPSVRISHECR